jgi:hypothetical protein
MIREGTINADWYLATVKEKGNEPETYLCKVWEEPDRTTKIKYKRCFNHAVGDIIDIEADDCCLRGFGTIEERQFYRKAYQETFDAIMDSGNYDNSYPEWWETTGYTKEELDFSWVLQDKHNFEKKNREGLNPSYCIFRSYKL